MQELNTKRKRIILAVTGALIFLTQSACVERALVRDCQDVKDTPFKNCEIVKKL